jgi:hypothetical protein
LKKRAGWKEDTYALEAKIASNCRTNSGLGNV